MGHDLAAAPKRTQHRNYAIFNPMPRNDDHLSMVRIIVGRRCLSSLGNKHIITENQVCYELASEVLQFYYLPAGSLYRTSWFQCSDFYFWSFTRITSQLNSALFHKYGAGIIRTVRKYSYGLRLSNIPIYTYSLQYA